jgi:hypothetical protein
VRTPLCDEHLEQIQVGDAPNRGPALLQALTGTAALASGNQVRYSALAR